MAGRPRKSIEDIYRLYDHDPDMMLRWLRKSGGWRFECEMSEYIASWIKRMDKKKYHEIKSVVDQAVDDYLKPKTPDNVIPFKRAGGE